MEIKEYREIKCCNEKSFLVRSGGHREKHTLMSTHNCTIWMKSDATKKITVVNSALEDFSPIKHDFNCKQEREKYKKKLQKLQLKWYKESRSGPAPVLLTQSPPVVWEVQVRPLLSPHPAASCKIHYTASQQRRAPCILEKSHNLPRWSFIYSVPLKEYQLSKYVKERRRKDRHLAPQYQLVFAANISTEFEDIKDKIEWALHWKIKPLNKLHCHMINQYY